MWKNNKRSIARLPWVTLTLAGTAIALQCFGTFSEGLAYDRVALETGELWRAVSGHLTHWNFDHMIWDVLMFVLLGATIERRSRGCLLCIFLLSAVSISTAIWFFQPAINQYRGLSGIDSALFILVATTLFCDERQGQRLRVCGALVATIFGFVAKIGFELATGRTIFVDSAAAGFTPLPLAHAVGALVAAAVLSATSVIAPRQHLVCRLPFPRFRKIFSG